MLEIRTSLNILYLWSETIFFVHLIPLLSFTQLSFSFRTYTRLFYHSGYLRRTSLPDTRQRITEHIFIWVVFKKWPNFLSLNKRK